MVLLESTENGLSNLFSNYYSSLMSSGTDFLLKAVLLRGFSGSLHSLLLFGLFVSWVCQRFKMGNREGSKERFKKTRSLYYKQTLIYCLDVSMFNFFSFYFLFLSRKGDYSLSLSLSLSLSIYIYIYILLCNFTLG